MHPLSHSKGNEATLLLSPRKCFFYSLSPPPWCHQHGHGVTLKSTSSWVHKLTRFAHLLETEWWKDEGEGAAHCSSRGHGRMRVLLSLRTTPQLRAEIIAERFLSSPQLQPQHKVISLKKCSSFWPQLDMFFSMPRLTCIINAQLIIQTCHNFSIFPRS